MKVRAELPVGYDTAELAGVCRRHAIERLSVFGSALRDDFGPDSDIDLLVEFEAGTRIGFIGMAGIESELSEVFGRAVDLVTPGSLSGYFVDEVLAEAVPIHVAA